MLNNEMSFAPSLYVYVRIGKSWCPHALKSWWSMETSVSIGLYTRLLIEGSLCFIQVYYGVSMDIDRYLAFGPLKRPLAPSLWVLDHLIENKHLTQPA